MFVKLVQLVDLLAYAFVASQAFFYLLAMSKAQKNLGPSSYTELRNLLDKNLQISLRIVYYSALGASLLWLVLSVMNLSLLHQVTSAIAMVALLVDMLFLFKGDIPINKIISGWTPDNYPADWESYRRKWFGFYHRRQVADIIGFVSLLVGAVFG